MSATPDLAPSRNAPLPGFAGLRPVRWHRPLLVLAAAMTVLAAICAVAMVIDDRQITGVDAWQKPFKFAVSTGLYSITLAWMIGLLTRFTRAARIAGTVTAIALAIELVIITGFAVIGETSHFNVSTPLHAAAWGIMAASIVAVWGMTWIVAVLLFRNPLGDPARSFAIRAGALLALLGMALAFLMTGPQGDQISHYQGVIGAHTVGVPDGGPGLPLLGWSTVAGDLRIPHFVGMHALQVLPIFVILLEWFSRRVMVLRDASLRLQLVATASCAYLAVVLLLTWQALIGQSIVAPAGPIPVVGIVIAAAAVVVAGGFVVTARRSVRALTSDHPAARGQGTSTSR